MGVIWKGFGVWFAVGSRRRKFRFLAEEEEENWVPSGWLLLWECTRERGEVLGSLSDVFLVECYWFLFYWCGCKFGGN